MSLAHEIAALFQRDLTRLLQELRAFPDDATLWKHLPGVSNPAGNLVLHLEGNLREYIGRQLGGIPYVRRRETEFSETEIPASELIRRIESVVEMIPKVVAALSSAELDAAYPENVLGVPASTQQVLISLHGHLNYHLGQIDYLRRILTNGAAVAFTGLTSAAKATGGPGEAAGPRR